MMEPLEGSTCPEEGCEAKVKVHKPFGAIIYQCEDGHKIGEISLVPVKPSDENLLEESCK